jgi:peptidoglycan hydrolase CwlO-like protein
MAENALQTAQSFMQDVLAPDVRELKVKVDSLDKRIDSLERHMNQRFEALEKRMDERFEAFEKRMDERFASLEKRTDDRFAAMQAQNDANMREVLGAIARLELMTENIGLRATMEVRERVAVLEARAA